MSTAIQWWRGDFKHLRRTVICSSEWYGSKQGGFYISPDLLHQRSVVYSFGIGADVSFCRELIAKHGCFIFAFDPTPQAISWIGQNMTDPRFVFQPVGLGVKTGLVDFFLPTNPERVGGGVSLQKELSEALRIEVMLKTLNDIADANGHRKIDLLKLDIEGFEYEIIPAVLSSGLRIDQMVVEFHNHLFDDGLERTRKSIAMLREHGYEIFAVSETNNEVSLIRKVLVEIA